MFTGIIQTIGRVVAVDPKGTHSYLTVSSDKIKFVGNDSVVSIGDSIAVNGVCLTVVALSEGQFSVDVSAETLACTVIGDINSGERVNLELALLPTTRIGGHFVSGHVDGVGEVSSITPDDGSKEITFKNKGELSRFIARKGSICVDGVSLTVNEVNGDHFSINVIPHTLKETTMGDYKVGDKVNIEVDVIARYLERMIEGSTQKNSPLSNDLLQQAGFLG